MSKNATLVVMAAGMGSRFGGLKQMEPISADGRVLLDFSVYDAKKAGFTKIVFVIKEAIAEDFINIVGKRIEKMIDVEYVYQELYKLPEGFTCPETREKPWGTAHAILCCKDAVNEPFAVVNADDYYGRGAFEKIYNELVNNDNDYCMAGFRLKNTLTENGTVARGVCVVKDDDCLESVTERTKINNECQFTEDDGATWTQLAPDTLVSMNLWGFRPDLFDYIEKGFTEFLKDNINEPKKEYYLPLIVTDLIESGTKKVKVLAAEDKWYGVTYKEDKPGVVAAIEDMISKGYYD
ncbi:MAG: NTP transferase domain-containing protein [Clostridia bacterium]|nr:NTP transferase domain-containing protein [Clostridia bacterium]